MPTKIPTSRPWYRIAPTGAQVLISMYIAASVATLVILAYAPDVVQWWLN